MAVSQQQKVDFLLKKLGFTKTKTGLAVDSTLSGTKKAGFGEAIPSPLIIANSSLWNEADSIPATPPGSDTNQVRVYLAATSGHRMTVDTTVADNRAFIAFSTYNNSSSTRLDNWIDTQFGAAYLIKVFKGDPNSGGVQLSAAGSGNADGWFFDYSAGVLNFNDTNVPSGVQTDNIYIVGYRYIGQTGAPTSGISTFSYLDLTVERNLDVGIQGGISTFRNNIDLNADLDVDGHTNLDNVSIAGVVTATTFVGNGDFVELDVDGHTNLDNVSVSGVTTFSGDTRVDGGILKVFDGNANTNHLQIGTGGDLRIYHGGHNYYDAYNNARHLFMHNGSEVACSMIPNNKVALFYDNVMKFETATSGVKIVGTTTSTQLAITGVSTFTGNIDANGDLDVDGHTNLDNVSIAGFTTITQDLDVDGHTNLDNVSISGFTTITQDLNVDGHTNLDNVSVAGVTTFAENVIAQKKLSFADSPYIGGTIPPNSLRFGNNDDLILYHTGNYSGIDERGGGTGGLVIHCTNDFTVKGNASNKLRIKAIEGGATELYHNNTKRLETTNSGVSITGNNVVSGNVTAVDGTFSGNVSIGGTLTYEDVKNIDAVGLITARSGIRVTGGVIEALAGENKIPSLYAAMGNLPSAGSYHGMFAHVHATGRGYFAHAGNWLELVNKEINGVVGTGTERYNIGPVDLTTLDVSGISTFAGNVDINADIDVDGHTNLDNVSIAGVTTFASHAHFGDNDKIFLGTGNDFSIYHSGGHGVIHNTTGNLYVVENQIDFQATAGGTINFRIAGSNILVPTTSTLNVDGTLDVDGHSNLDNVSIAGFTTITQDLDVDGHTNLDNVSIAGFTTITQDLDVDGHTNLDNVSIAGVTTTSGHIYINADNKKLIVGQHSDIQIFNDGSNSRIENGSGQLIVKSPIFTVQSSGSNQIISRDLAEVDLYYNGIKKFSTASSGINVVGTTTSTQLAITGVSTFTGAIDANGDLDVDGHTNLDNVNVSGVSTFAGNTFVEGVLKVTGNTVRIEGGSPVIILDDTNHNHQYRVLNNNGTFEIKDHTNSADRFTILSNGIVRSHGNFLALSDFDVDGHTELDNVNIVGVTTHQGHVLPATDSTYDLGSSSKQWRNFYVSNIVSAPGFGIIGPDLTVRNFTATGISTHVGIATFNNATFHDDVTFTTANNKNIVFDKSANDLKFGDNIQARFGDSNDLSIYHDSTSSNILDTFGGLNIRSNVLSLKNGASNSKYLEAVNASHVKLYFAGNEKLSTTTTGINVTGLTDTDTLTTGNATFTGTITAGGATGNNGQYLKSTGSGVAWATFPSLRTRQTSTASAGQTTFSFSYTVGLLDVFVNGIKLTDAEFTATNGSSVVLAVGCFVGDIVELVSYNTVSAGGGASGIGNVVEDLTPQLGGNLDLFNKFVTGTGGISITGVVTATTFIGDGSGLTGIVASGSGVVIKNSGSTVGTAGTINFGDNLSVTPISAGIVTVTAGVTTSQFNVNKLDVSGISTFKGNIDVNADLDVDGHTNLDNVSIAGVTTFADDVKAVFGNGGDLEIYHESSSHKSIIKESGASGFHFQGSNIVFDNTAGNKRYLNMVDGGAVELYFNSAPGGAAKLATTSGGINVTGNLNVSQDLDVDGHTNLDNVSIAGVVTATTFKGALQGTSGTFSSGVDITGDLDVDGHTDLDNVSVAGVVTATSFVGDGSGLTGITASGSGIVIKHDGSTVGTAGTINFGTNLDVSALSGGAVTITATGSGSTAEVRTNTLEVVGVSTFAGITTVTGNTLFTKQLGVSGVSTFANSVRISGALPDFTVDSGTFRYDGGKLFLLRSGVNSRYYSGTPGGAKGPHVFYTHAGGSTVEMLRLNGDTGATLVGVMTATSFSGDGSNLTGVNANVGITTNLSGTFSASAGSPSTLNSFGYGSGDTVFEYTVYVKNGSNFQTQKLLAMRDGTTVHSTQFAVMYSSSLLVQCDATISSGNILLRATPETGVSGSTTFKVKREVM